MNDGDDDAETTGKETDAEADLTFEEALHKLEGIVDRLESGDMGLEDAMAAFEEGHRLARVCRARLEEAEGKLEELLESGETAPFEVEDDEGDDTEEG